MAREYKLNFQAAFKDFCSVTGCVLRNSDGQILGTWVNRFASENPFCAEAEAAIQALKIAGELKLEKVMAEVDALNVIMAINGLDVFEDWKAKSLTNLVEISFQ